MAAADALRAELAATRAQLETAQRHAAQATAAREAATLRADPAERAPAAPPAAPSSGPGPKVWLAIGVGGFLAVAAVVWLAGGWLVGHAGFVGHEVRMLKLVALAIPGALLLAMVPWVLMECLPFLATRLNPSTDDHGAAVDWWRTMHRNGGEATARMESIEGDAVALAVYGSGIARASATRTLAKYLSLSVVLVGALWVFTGLADGMVEPPATEHEPVEWLPPLPDRG